MTTFDPQLLISAALQVAGHYACSEDCSAGGVAAALLTGAGTIHTGICIDTACSLGFCAEHAAIADMLKNRMTRIVAIVAVGADGEIMPPCGRCRELIRQVDPDNWGTSIIVAKDKIVTLAELLPYGEAVKPAPSSAWR